MIRTVGVASLPVERDRLKLSLPVASRKPYYLIFAYAAGISGLLRNEGGLQSAGDICASHAVKPHCCESTP